ncbi:MAG: GH1 family beta-glucosidase [Acidobacteriota bacterium]|nr:GH1 family beta-glucosidase [Acidobacteriota bacterium]
MPMQLSRRAIARLLGGSAASMMVSRSPAEAEDTAQTRLGASKGFPQGFLWGSATASYQVEGAVKEAGRGPSIWDTFSHTPGRVHLGDTGDVADDFFHRYREDIKLMQGLGLKSFRFSVAWSRVFPQGGGAPNPQGLDFYHRIVDALLEAGIEPFCTLYHWDLPQALQDKGGWENRDTASLFADYCGYTAGQLSDKVKHFMTMNEMRTFVELGYGTGTHAPGLTVGEQRLAQLNHYVVLAHGLAVRAIRAKSRPGTQVGIADNVQATTPVYDAPEHVQAARNAMREQNAMFLTVVQEGRYTDLYLKRLGANAPKFTAEEMEIIRSPMDFVGINIYQPTHVRAEDSEQGYALVPPPSSYPHMFSSWLYVGPEALYWGPKLVADIWKVKTIYITENGASSADTIAPDGAVYDTDRVMFLHSYLLHLQRAVSEGVPVKGYFLWSLLDNYEWADGYEKRFGITYVDFETQKRTLKLSGQFYRNLIATNAIS